MDPYGVYNVLFEDPTRERERERAAIFTAGFPE